MDNCIIMIKRFFKLWLNNFFFLDKFKHIFFNTFARWCVCICVGKSLTIEEADFFYKSKWLGRKVVWNARGMIDS